MIFLRLAIALYIGYYLVDMQAKLVDVVVAGHICLDITPEFGRIRAEGIDDVLAPGKLVNIHEANLSTGGAVPNVGVALSKLGVEAALMAKTGDDLFGRAIVGRLKDYVKPGGISRVAGEHSSYTIVIAVPGFDRIFLHNPGTNDTFGCGDIDFDVVKKARLFYLGYPPLMRRLYIDDGAELIRIFARVRSLGVPTSLDMALPDPDSESGRVNWDLLLRRLLPYVDIFLPSIEEAMFMVKGDRLLFLKRQERDFIDCFTTDDLTCISDILLSYGAKIVGLKCGHRGVYLRTAEGQSHGWSCRRLWAPPYHVKTIASATGSGDSAVAGFLTGYLKGESPEICVRCANAAGAQSMQALDAVSGIKSWDEVVKMAHSHNKDSLKISADGWVYDKSEELWRGPGDAG